MSGPDVFAITFMAFIGGFVMALQIAVYVTNRERLALLRTANLINTALQDDSADDGAMFHPEQEGKTT